VNLYGYVYRVILYTFALVTLVVTEIIQFIIAKRMLQMAYKWTRRHN